jgi:signal transduction histidine kinase
MNKGTCPACAPFMLAPAPPRWGEPYGHFSLTQLAAFLLAEYAGINVRRAEPAVYLLMLSFMMSLSQRRALMVALIAGMQLAVAFLDNIVPDEIPIGDLQYVPIVLAASAFGYRGVLAVVVSSGLLYYLANYAERSDANTIPALALTDLFYLVVGLAAARFFADQRRLRALEQERVDLAVAEERARLAREIHDTAGQSLMAVVVQSEAASAALAAGDHAKVSDRVERITQLARDSLSEVRRSVLGLSPSPLEQYALPEALEHLAKRLGNPGHTAIQCSIKGSIPDMPPAAAAGLYRIAQEALVNAIKHAQAKHIEVNLDREDDEIVLTVSDDGIGVGTRRDGAPANSGFGLRGMEQRARQLGAIFNVQSTPGQGTRVRVVLPLATQAVTPAILEDARVT